VIEASDGRAGLRHYLLAPMDLVITDLLMPEQEGMETIQAMRRVHPQVKIIAISGGGQTGRLDFLEAAAVLGAQRTLRKPFRPRELLTAVRELMQAESESHSTPPMP
jgi:DNA-binding response OmpR family regulator